MSGRRIVFATSNLGKLIELRELLGPSWQVSSGRDFPQVGEVDETADTFAGNAELHPAPTRSWTRA